MWSQERGRGWKEDKQRRKVGTDGSKSEEDGKEKSRSKNAEEEI